MKSNKLYNGKTREFIIPLRIILQDGYVTTITGQYVP